VINLVYLKEPKKLWPGYSYENLEIRIRGMRKIKSDGSAIEIDEIHHKQESTYLISENPINSLLGKFWGPLESTLFVLKAYQDQLKLTTKLGNIWIAYKYLMALIFFAGLVLFSGGADINLNIFKIISIFGCWLIFESAFIRASISLFKYGKIESDLGISARIITLASYLYSWIEILTLAFLLVFWKIYDSQQLINLKELSGLVFALFTFLIIGLPFSYLLSTRSRNHIDLRFITPTFLRMLMITTPVFGKFHFEFPLIATALSYSPFNLPFIFLAEMPYDIEKIWVSYITFCIVGYTSWKFTTDTKKKKWSIVK
jgi:hypothetical protein